MASKIGDLYWEVNADTTKFNKGLKTTETNAKGLGTSFSNLAKGIVAGMGVAAVAGVAALSKELISAASEAEETTNKFNVVFEAVADQAEEAGDRIKEEFKLSDQDTKAFLSQVGDITSGLGATSDEALKAAETITTLGLDIDSFANLAGGAEQAVSALTSLFTGEREAAKALGIVINETNLKQYAEDTGKVYEELTQLEKGFLSLELAQEQSTLAIGDFANSIDSYANQTRVAEAATEDLKTALGKSLLPAATEAVSGIGELTRILADYIDKRNDVVDVEKEVRETGKTTSSDLEALRKVYSDNADELSQLKYEYDEYISSYRKDSEEGKKAAIIAEQRWGGEISNLTESQSLLGKRIESLQLNTYAQTRYADAIAQSREEQAQSEAAARDEAAAREESRLALEEYLSLVESEYSKTTEGQIAGLKEEIALWQEYAETAVNTLPEIQAIILAKQEELAGLTEESEAIEGLTTTSSMYYDTAINNNERLKAVQDGRLAALDAEKQKVEETMQAYFTGAGLVGDAWGAINTIQANYNDAEVQRLQRTIDATEDGTEEKIRLEEEYARRKVQLEREEAIRAKNAAIFGAGISTAQAIIGFLANPGGIPGIALSALAGVTGAAQIAAIQSNPLPSFEQGGIIPEVPGVPATGDNMLARVNPGEHVVPADEANQPTEFVFMFDGDVFARGVVDRINSGQNLINLNRGTYSE